MDVTLSVEPSLRPVALMDESFTLFELTFAGNDIVGPTAIVLFAIFEL